MGLGLSLREASVGIDFGSTNTSVAYSVDGNVEGIHFNNHRISLLQATRQTSYKERDLFFFQSKEIEGNAIKSILTLHNSRRAVSDFSARKEVSGGMPCFDPSLLPVETVKENKIILKCHDIGQVTLVHNMKWTTQESDIDNKKAFLRSLMLHVYAQLYSEGCVPVFLKWSYPSAMGEMLKNQYSEIWRDLSNDLSPIKDKPLEVCKSDVDITIPQDDSGWGASLETSDSWNLGSEDGILNGNFDSESNGWGDDNSPTTGWGDTEEEVNTWNDTQSPQDIDDLVPDNNEIDFSFQTVDSEKCMTEACAVANYMTTRDIHMTSKSLTLCFDVGGSTTDISALLLMPEGLTMIKQNSIMFAAQRVSQAASCEPKLKDVLMQICKQKNIRIPGLTFGPDKYSEETASFYLEQVFDRLDNTGLEELYSKISTTCPKLMAVNMYVTGLIIYYSGQMTKKLIDVIRTSLSKDKPFYKNFTPNVNVMFAGKGARIFEWLSTTQYNVAQKYYQGMFIKGLGSMDTAKTYMFGPPTINLSKGVSSDVKYEVSKGLAIPANKSIRVPQDSKESVEIIGEENFAIIKASTGEEIPLHFDNAITSKMMAQIGQCFQQSAPSNKPFACEKFSDFALVYYLTIDKLFPIRMSKADFIEGFKKMNIDNYIQNLPEYRKAKQNQKENDGFDFVAPVIIIEGMKFYHDCLLPKI